MGEIGQLCPPIKPKGKKTMKKQTEKVTDPAILRARQLGKDAFKAGDSINSNPFPDSGLTKKLNRAWGLAFNHMILHAMATGWNLSETKPTPPRAPRTVTRIRHYA